MRVLVTGGAGFIGSHIADRFAARGDEVCVVDNLYSGRRENLDPQRRFDEVDVSTAELGRVFDEVRPELVVHAAAQVRVRCEDHLLDARYNVLGSLNVIHHAVRTEVGRLIYLSSGGAVYGEPEYLPCDEEHPVAPLSAYGLTKYTPEHYLRLYKLSDGLDYIVLRPGNVYGPRQDQRGEAGVCAIFTGKLLAGAVPVINGSGDNTRDYVYVADVVEAVRLAAEVEEPAERVFNVGTGLESSVNEIYRELAALTGYRGRAEHAPEPLEVKRIALDYTRIRKTLGWVPKIELHEGLKRLVAWSRGRTAERR
jgi:UDP-glucose 4-epimerase